MAVPANQTILPGGAAGARCTSWNHQLNRVNSNACMIAVQSSVCTPVHPPITCICPAGVGRLCRLWLPSLRISPALGSRGNYMHQNLLTLASLIAAACAGACLWMS